MSVTSVTDSQRASVSLGPPARTKGAQRFVLILGVTACGGGPRVAESQVDAARSSAPASSTPSSPKNEGTVCSGWFCDDFEDGVPGAPPSLPWTSEPNGATVAISNEKAFSGRHSVVVRAGTARYGRGYITLSGAPVFPAAEHGHFGRMRVFMESTPRGSIHFTFVQAEGPSADGTYRVLNRFGGQHEGRLMGNFETLGISTDCWDHSTTVMPTQDWVCLEWHFALESNEMELWVNGQAIEDVHSRGQGEGCVGNDLEGKWLAPRGFDTLHVGYEHYQASDPRDVYLDDVALGDSRIGCD